MVALLIFIMDTLNTVFFGQKLLDAKCPSGNNVIKNHALITDSAFSAFFASYSLSFKRQHHSMAWCLTLPRANANFLLFMIEFLHSSFHHWLYVYTDNTHVFKNLANKQLIYFQPCLSIAGFRCHAVKNKKKIKTVQ